MSNTVGNMAYDAKGFEHSFYAYGWFNVAVKMMAADGMGGGTEHTRFVNPEPYSFEDACIHMNGILKPLGQNMLGFQKVVDVNLVPVEPFSFVSDAARDAWLSAARQNGFGRNNTTLSLLREANHAFAQTLRGEDGQYDPGRFRAWLDNQLVDVERRQADLQEKMAAHPDCVEAASLVGMGVMVAGFEEAAQAGA